MCFLDSEIAIPGGDGLNISTTSNVFGNDVILRNTYVQGGARKSWLLFQRPLTAGLLAEFFVYVHSVAPGRIVNDSVELKLQIWREVSVVARTYRLLYERAFNVDHSTDTGIYYAVSTFVYAKYLQNVVHLNENPAFMCIVTISDT